VAFNVPSQPGEARVPACAPWRLGGVVFAAGAGTLSTEIAASRLLAPYFGNSTVVWANIIGLILVYLSLGYWLGGKLADRAPRPELLGGIVLVAAAFIAATPFAARPILDAALRGFDSISVGVVVGSFLAALALFAVPVTLLGAVSPFAIRLSLTDLERAGAVAGRLYALSTVGSIIGTFVSALVAIQAFGTQRTMVGTAALLAGCSVLLIGRRAAPATIAALGLLLVPAGTVKASSGLLFEKESPYQYVSVVQWDDGTRVLQLNEGVAYHSMWRRGSVLTGQYWDLFAMLPPLLGHPARNMLVIGNAGGTIDRMYGLFYPGIAIDGVELDPRLHVYTADGRPFLERTRKRYDLIVVDAYRQPYVPFYLATREFFELARRHLRPGGILALNIAKVPGDDRLTRAVDTTLLAAFPQVWRWPALRFNDLVMALDRPVRRSVLMHRASNVRGRLLLLLPPFRRSLVGAHSVGRVLTDDRAPVEWLTDRMLLEQIARGRGLDEGALPTEP
jgi:predicted membrane-bound spermidine synthase